ncbi:hypothetical protein [Psychrobacter sp. W2-37-MNA-CIBAN-0211]|uniref:hypothetical protein n=1 Tax=Psychrobacter sp. W2-37-MNA-CIBAN-0211 TaxID=3140443 RepID=UPI00331B144B
MSTTDCDKTRVYGTTLDVAADLYSELLTTGYSLLESDVIKVLTINIKKYAAWADAFNDAPATDDECVRPKLVIDDTTVIGVDDWAIIEPLVRAHCDLVQARRMEGAQNLGVQGAGLSSSEARQIYADAETAMKKEAFQFQPFSTETPKPKFLGDDPYWLWVRR